MKLIRIAGFVSFLILGLGGAAHAGTVVAGPVAPGTDEYVICRATNAGSRAIPFTLQVLDQNGVVLNWYDAKGSPFATPTVASTSETASLCRATTSGSGKSLRVVAIVRKYGGAYETRGMADSN